MVVPENSINNIMGGLESTGGVRLHTHRRKLKQRFDIIRKLGQGTYGKVQLGVNKETGQEVAIKTIKKCKIETEADLIRIKREIQIMSSLRHPYIIHIYEVFENKDKILLVMEYAAGGELYDYLSERKVLEEEEARRIFRQISMAVYYCHKHQICHRDLKLENILLDEERNAKIADFGLSNVFDPSRLLSTFCGSPLYASPEIVKGIPYKGPEVDCWSLGVLLYTLVYGTMPFDGSNFKRLVRQISQGEYYEPKTPSNASKLIRGLLTVDGETRYEISRVCDDTWLNENQKDSCLEGATSLAKKTPVRLDLLLALANPLPSPEKPGNEEVVLTRSDEKKGDNEGEVEGEGLRKSLEESQETQIEKEKEETQSQAKTELDKREVQPCQRPPPLDMKMRSQSLGNLPKGGGARPSFLANLKPPRPRAIQTEGIPEVPDEACAIVAKTSPKGEEEKKDSPGKSEKIKDKVETVAETGSPEATNKEEGKPGTSTLEKKKVKKKASASPSSDGGGTTGAEKKKKIQGGTKLVKKKKPDGVTETAEIAETLAKASKVDEALKKDEKKAEEEVSTQGLPNLETPPKPLVSSPAMKTSQVESGPTQPSPLISPQVPQTPPPSGPPRRKSRVFETAEMFAAKEKEATSGSTGGGISPASEKKVVFPGIKVSDAKAAFERRSSLVSQQQQQPAPPPVPMPRAPAAPEPHLPEFNLASTLHLDKLVQSELSKADPEEDEDLTPVQNRDSNVQWETPEPEQIATQPLPMAGTEETVERVKKDKAVKVISNAIEGEKKASTLPRRKISAPPQLKNVTTSKVEPEHMVANTRVSQIIYPTPVPTPRASLVKQVSSPPSLSMNPPGPRERIIPIRLEGDDERESRKSMTPPPSINIGVSGRSFPTQKQQSQSQQMPSQGVSSKTSSNSLGGRQDSSDSSFGGLTKNGEPIRKSPREVIIPIAVEGGGYVTPSPSALSRMSSLESGLGGASNESSVRRPASAMPVGFGLRSTRRRRSSVSAPNQGDGGSTASAADSLSSDEDDDNFEILTAENLFSTLLSRVRSLTQRLNEDEGRPPFPRLFSHHHPFMFDNPARRLSERSQSFNNSDCTSPSMSFDSDLTPWRRKRSGVETPPTSSATLPRARVTVHVPLIVDNTQKD